MGRTLLHAAGPVCFLWPPWILLLGVWIGVPQLAAVVLLLLAPALRKVFGEAGEDTPDWPEGVATVLHALPIIFALVFPLAMLATLWALHGAPIRGAGFTMGMGLSLWSVFILATCPAHELVHRADAASRCLGRCLAGMVGYPILDREHALHHADSSSPTPMEWPWPSESLWPFVLRRGIAVLRGSRERAAAPEARISMLTMVVAFAWADGWRGVALYLCVAGGVCFAMQAMTYIQHWGLAEPDQPEVDAQWLGWEDACRLQGWLTLGISFHHAHHDRPRTPYYRLRPVPGSPRLPAGYVVLLVVSVVPASWRRFMGPVLARWRARTGTPSNRARSRHCWH